MTDLRKALPALVPLAIEWAERASAEAATTGTPLIPEHMEMARRVGVRDVAKVRVVSSPHLPFPEHPLLQAAAVQTGLLGRHMAGLTLGHAVFIREDQYSPRLLSHELRHVAQYEDAGSIAAFLPVYLSQIVEVGYEAAPFEVDARNHEIAG